MPFIAEAPIQEAAPDHAGPNYQEERATLIAAGMTEEAAIQFLQNAWARDARLRHEQRAARMAEEQQAQEEVARQEIEAEERQAAEVIAAAEAERKEAEKKNVKAGDFDENRVVPSFNEPKPSLFAIEKLIKKEYIELWYFTREGCKEAELDRFTAPKDALGLTGREGEQVQFRSVASTRASKNARPDNALSWEQIALASKILVRCMEKAGWSSKHTDVLSKFFIELEFIRTAQIEEFDRAIIEYQYLVRFEWHAALGSTSSFNLSLISMERLNAIHNTLNAKEQRQLMASQTMLKPKQRANKFPLFSFHPSTPMRGSLLRPTTWADDNLLPCASHLHPASCTLHPASAPSHPASPRTVHMLYRIPHPHPAPTPRTMHPASCTHQYLTTSNTPHMRITPM